MKTIKLTKGHEVQVDDSDYEHLMQWKWYYSHGYATRDARLKTPEGKVCRQNIFMHRYLMDVIGKQGEVDHRDGDRLNNTKSNLRLCTRAQNEANKKINAKNTSGYKGVSWCATANMWRVRVGRKTVARFHNIKDAARKYNEVATDTYGDYARLNTIGENDG